MNRSRLVRLLMVPALAVPVVAASLALAGPATAGSVVCTALTGDATGSPNPPQITGCNDTANTGGTGTAVGALKSPSTMSWSTAGGTTVITFKDKLVTGAKNKCAAGDTEATIKGKVKGHGTGTGTSVSGKVSATVCVAPSGALSLLAGTTFKL